MTTHLNYHITVQHYLFVKTYFMSGMGECLNLRIVAENNITIIIKLQRSLQINTSKNSFPHTHTWERKKLLPLYLFHVLANSNSSVAYKTKDLQYSCKFYIVDALDMYLLQIDLYNIT